MSQPLRLVNEGSLDEAHGNGLFNVGGLPRVTGTITATVSQNPWSLTLSGGGTGQGWIAAGTTITLTPRLPQPVLYVLSFSFNQGFSLAQDGLQISVTPQTGNLAVVAFNAPLTLVDNVPSGSPQTLNLVIVVQAEGGETYSFDDPTIVFDPPQ